MWNNAQDAYLEHRILSADPLELVRLLYQAAIGAVREARRALSAGEIAARSRAISRACGIVLASRCRLIAASPSGRVVRLTAHPISPR